MFISKIHLNNFRQYKSAIFEFKKNKNGGLHIIIGKTGIGKTVLLNGIYWCLYGDEPKYMQIKDISNFGEYDKIDSTGLPLLNLQTIKDSNNSDNHEVTVEIWVTDNDGILTGEKNSTLIYKRIRKYKIEENKPRRIENFDQFSVTIVYNNSSRSSDIFEDEIADAYVSIFLPKDIRDYFFFDGEKLDRYFRETSGAANYRAINTISQLYILDLAKKYLNSALIDYRKESSKEPKLNEMQNELNILSEKINNKKEIIKKIEEQNIEAKKQVEGYIEKLRGIPDIRILNNKEIKLCDELKNLEEIRSTKEHEYRDIIFNYSTTIPVYNAIKHTISYIENKKKKGEFPPTIDDVLIKNILTKKICICEREITNREEAILLDIKSKMGTSSKVSVELLENGSILKSISNEISYFVTKMKKISEEKKQYDNLINNKNKEIEEVREQAKGYDKNIGILYDEKDKYEKLIKTNNISEFQENTALNAYKSDYDFKNIEYQKALGSVKTLNNLKTKIQFLQNTITYLENSEEIITNSIKNEIITITKNNFLNMISKKSVFKDVGMDENYNLYIDHVDGYRILHDLSGGEGEILALSFVMSLNEISGFKPPNIIDRPITMVSGQETLEKIANSFAIISKQKQIILMFNPDEYRNICKILDNECTDKYSLSISENERECIILKEV